MDEVALFQVNKALGTTVPRKKMRFSVSWSVEELSELIVQSEDCVPLRLDEAADKLLTLRVEM